jgi:hypothetical protein
MREKEKKGTVTGGYPSRVHSDRAASLATEIFFGWSVVNN